MVLMHADGNVRIGFDCGFNQVTQECFAGIFAGIARSLHDHGSADGARCGHDGLNLLEVVYVEGRNAVAVSSSMLKQLPQRTKCHSTKLRREKTAYVRC